MKIQDKIKNDGEMCVACGHARKFHWAISDYGSGPMKRDENYEMECHWGLDLGQCIQTEVCGCLKRKQDFCVISGI
jgi:hypothetical protein